MASKIPGPPGYPIIGNITDVDPGDSLRSFVRLADEYGEIYRLRLPGTNLVVVSTFALLDEICDESRFAKVPDSVVAELRHGMNDGLFTAFANEPSWGIAHRVLMPAFGPKSIRDMFDEMHDIASQLMLKWARQGPNTRIHTSDDFTRLALDTLALCSMGFRFNNFYSENEHEFVNAMGEFLLESGRRAMRPPLPDFVYRKRNQEYEDHIQILRKTAKSVLDERVANPNNDRKDLLDAMLQGRDTQTGEKMSDSSIIDNLITFLVAGHETTSGTLSYAMYELLRHPEVYRKLQEEVDNVVGNGPITVEHMQKLPYIEAVIREVLRLNSPIPLFSRKAIASGTLLGGKYQLEKDDTCIVLLSKTHLDPAIFEDPLAFKPERMLPYNFSKLPKNAWKPFGSGMRGCIGRPFAWQESVLAMALLFQNFEFNKADPEYVLENKQTLTIKPKEFYVKAVLREGITPTSLAHRLNGGAGTVPDTKHATMAAPRQLTSGEGASQRQPITILYGSNSGTCEAMAQRLASNAPSHGYRVSRVESLNSAIKNIPREQPVVIFTSSYDGEPPDNAKQFVKWLESVKSGELEGVRYCVFGCGNHDWAQTFHRIPRLVDGALKAAGAERLLEIGLTDAATDDVFVTHETWEDSTFWPAIRAMFKVDDTTSSSGVANTLQASVSDMRLEVLNLDMGRARVIATRSLTAEGEPLKKHIEIELPSEFSYRAGDYLAILPSNPRQSVLRALRRLHLPWDATVTIEDNGARLPTNMPIPAQSILSDYVELGQPATRRDVNALANTVGLNAEDKESLQWLGAEGYDTEISAKQVSILDLLEKHASIDISFGQFLSMLPPMHVRQYSISCSPKNPRVASLTFSVIRGAARSGQGEFLGIASSYLASLQAGDQLHVSVRSSHDAFHLPSDSQATTTPLIMVAAGTGIAPFRGFVEERMAMMETRQNVSPAVLYHGCRQRGQDDLYDQELGYSEASGAVVVKRAFSREPQDSEGCRYVQDRLWTDRHELLELWRQGAFLYICGSKEIYKAVGDIAVRFKLEAAKSKGIHLTETDAKSWWVSTRNVRHAVDVFD